jgi:hypothetical protein
MGALDGRARQGLAEVARDLLEPGGGDDDVRCRRALIRGYFASQRS